MKSMYKRVQDAEDAIITIRLLEGSSKDQKNNIEIRKCDDGYNLVIIDPEFEKLVCKYCGEKVNVGYDDWWHHAVCCLQKKCEDIREDLKKSCLPNITKNWVHEVLIDEVVRKSEGRIIKVSTI